MDIRVRFGRLLRRRRAALGLTQEEVAGRADSHAVYISEIERGVYNPTLAMLFELGRALEIHPAELLSLLPLNSALEERPVRRRMKRRRRPAPKSRKK